MKACVVGFGAMGQLVASLLKEELTCVVALEKEYKSLFDTNGDFDVIIDFSHPANLDMIIEYALTYHKPCVLATTGYSDEELLKIEKLACVVPVLRSANFSLGVIVLNRLVKQVTQVLADDFDIEIVEAHHHNKIDSPSGTAKMLYESASLRSNRMANYGRSGFGQRKPNEIGISSIRGGTIVGTHEVLFCGEDETISLKHTAQSKRIFAIGAIKAARFLLTKKAGLYDMEDVLFKEE